MRALYWGTRRAIKRRMGAPRVLEPRRMPSSAAQDARRRAIWYDDSICGQNLVRHLRIHATTLVSDSETIVYCLLNISAYPKNMIAPIVHYERFASRTLCQTCAITYGRGTRRVRWKSTRAGVGWRA